MLMVKRACAVLLLIGLLAVPASTQNHAANQQQYQKARDICKQCDELRRQGNFKDAKTGYEAAVGIWTGLGNAVFAEVTRGMAELCGTMPIAMMKLKDGTYSGTARGYIGEVTLEVDIKGGKLTDVRVTQQKETNPGRSLSLIPERIIQSQSPSVDGVTGATTTSYAVMAASRRAIAKAQQTDKSATTMKP